MFCMDAGTGPAVLMEQVEQMTCNNELTCEGRWQLSGPAPSQYMLYGSDAGFGDMTIFRWLGCRMHDETMGNE